MNMITKDLGAVSAYAYAVEKGYTGTESEYAELMASYATVGQTAVTAAQTASEKAQQASASATSASQSASSASASATSAQASATTATAKASEAQQSATTATTKAQEASQSASESAQSAQTAVQAKQDAQTAKTASETAQASAESARDDAESARDTAQQYAESINPEKLIGAYPTDTATGAIASFPDGADNIPMKSVKVRIEPKQAGTGDPSPDNVRPISGWTEINVQRTGKNLFEYDENKVTTATTNVGTTRAIYPLGISGRTVSFSAIQKGESTTSIYINIGRRKNNIATIVDAFIRPNEINQRTFTFANDEEAILMSASQTENSLTLNLPKYNIQVELNSEITAYEPYTGHSLSIPLPQTVYGGTLDVVSGELVVDMAMVDLGTLDWRKTTTSGETNDRWACNAPNDAAVTPTSSNKANFVCENYATLTADDTWFKRKTGIAALNKTIYIYDPNMLDMTSAEFKSAMSGVQLCYKLATPITLTLSPTEIRSLLGTNNIWADTGDTEVTYRADIQKYIQRKIVEAVSALA